MVSGGGFAGDWDRQIPHPLPLALPISWLYAKKRTTDWPFRFDSKQIMKAFLAGSIGLFDLIQSK
jgi:hypothetical protein